MKRKHHEAKDQQGTKKEEGKDKTMEKHDKKRQEEMRPDEIKEEGSREKKFRGQD